MAVRMERCAPGEKTAQGRPLTTASAPSTPRSFSSATSSAASPRTTSTSGKRAETTSANRGLISTARCLPRPPRRRWIAPLNGPVPGPSSTTTGSPVAGTVTVIASASPRELGERAPVCTGARQNSRMTVRVSLSMVSFRAVGGSSVAPGEAGAGGGEGGQREPGDQQHLQGDGELPRSQGERGEQGRGGVLRGGRGDGAAHRVQDVGQRVGHRGRGHPRR